MVFTSTPSKSKMYAVATPYLPKARLPLDRTDEHAVDEVTLDERVEHDDGDCGDDDDRVLHGLGQVLAREGRVPGHLAPAGLDQDLPEHDLQGVEPGGAKVDEGVEVR